MDNSDTVPQLKKQNAILGEYIPNLACMTDDEIGTFIDDEIQKCIDKIIQNYEHTKPDQNKSKKTKEIK